MSRASHLISGNEEKRIKRPRLQTQLECEKINRSVTQSLPIHPQHHSWEIFIVISCLTILYAS